MLLPHLCLGQDGLLALDKHDTGIGSGHSEAHRILGHLVAVGCQVVQPAVHEVLPPCNPVLTAVLALRQHIPAVISVVLHHRPAVSTHPQGLADMNPGVEFSKHAF